MTFGLFSNNFQGGLAVVAAPFQGACRAAVQARPSGRVGVVGAPKGSAGPLRGLSAERSRPALQGG